MENKWKKEKPKFLEFAIFYHNEHIGAVSVYFENKIGELGWMIHKKYWRNGFAYKAAKALIYYAKTERKVNHFLVYCDTKNFG